ncbi:peptide MFS transporter [Flavobacterium psychrophilum]|uniref:Probable proton-dependent di-tripeptide transporter n=4 Tax=Flavobacterium psychrophilum TaxID=96345 RepID=A6H219_FLAPJ|nr:peptide MFS transporter [Flavobacterium psychrophilum]AIG31063.1 amino acid transporter [Flavobacterium psychrophilum]AIG33340.1 amino acid transporter [Flavobacterium psychrophilum]AIG35490.1 amino acid transporter [Flavobacterium psychrophilum]AIG37851.1 amino acid transporter [Flavobacterium psychrophilum]AIG40122.1 amino acid transporter [Flavobacterium psychrophilum]
MSEVVAQKGHPKGLWVLFGTEMWERFNFYGMRAILTLFLVNSLMMREEDASLIYGGFLGLCYLTPMLGGFISDRFFGNRNCIMLGGLMMAVGQFLLFFSASVFSSNISLATTFMWSALGIIIFGNGFFKPNISSMVGSLYPKQEKSKLDTAFTIFYMGINLGAFLGQLICPIVGDVKDAGGIRDIHAFKWGFLAASIAMLIGTIIFYFLKNKYVVTPEGKPLGGLPKDNDDSHYEEGESQKAVFSQTALISALVAFCGLGLLFYFVFGQNPIYSLIYASGITLAGLIISDSSLTKVERDRILVIYIVAFFVIFFWAAFEQAGSSLTFIADNQCDRNFFGYNMPPSMVQIFNGLFVVAFAVPFSMLWDYLRSKDREPISPMKQAFGLALIALSYFIIAHNVKDLGNSGLLAIKWLILLYLIQTCAELCLSPIGLSLVGKLSPKRFSSLLYGVFFLSNASGYALAGTLGSIMPATGDKFNKAKELGIDLQAVLDKKIVPTAEQLKLLATNQISDHNPIFAGFEIHNLFEFFMVFVVLTGLASLILFALTPVLKKMMHGVR